MAKKKTHEKKKIIETDPLGMYTGKPADGGAPTQDADDL